MSRQREQRQRDIRVVDRFVKEVDEMFTTYRLVRDGLHVNMTVHWDRDKGFEFSGSEHDEEDIRAYLPALRRFLLPSDALYVETVRPIIRRHVTDPRLASDLDTIGDEWERRTWVLPFKHNLTFEDYTMLTINPLDAFDLYVNGKVAHVDLAKAERLERVTAMLPRPVMQFMVLDCAVDATKHVGFLLNTIQFARARGTWSEAAVVPA